MQEFILSHTLAGRYLTSSTHTAPAMQQHLVSFYMPWPSYMIAWWFKSRNVLHIEGERLPINKKHTLINPPYKFSARNTLAWSRWSFRTTTTYLFMELWILLQKYTLLERVTVLAVRKHFEFCMHTCIHARLGLGTQHFITPLLLLLLLLLLSPLLFSPASSSTTTTFLKTRRNRDCWNVLV